MTGWMEKLYVGAFVLAVVLGSLTAIDMVHEHDAQHRALERRLEVNEGAVRSIAPYNCWKARG